MTAIPLPAALGTLSADLATAEDNVSAADEALKSAKQARDKAMRQLKDRILSSAFAEARTQHAWTGAMSILDIGVYVHKVIVSVGYFADDDTRPFKTIRVEFDR